MWLEHPTSMDVILAAWSTPVHVTSLYAFAGLSILCIKDNNGQWLDASDDIGNEAARLKIARSGRSMAGAAAGNVPVVFSSQGSNPCSGTETKIIASLIRAQTSIQVQINAGTSML
ncbi:hypothetical protein ACH5RR_021515 [Cinchona calisaya]|uniref:Uncharacterized protein n=1 Tax=Cinchona calisaya TaxID=153742 RepID=A0ABD2ZHI7_9GENT